MNYFSKIKPVLNKLSELNLYDSLEVVRAYMQASAKVTGGLVPCHGGTSTLDTLNQTAA